MTEFLSQFEINAKMDISKNQWRSTGGMVASFVLMLSVPKQLLLYRDSHQVRHFKNLSKICSYLIPHQCGFHQQNFHLSGFCLCTHEWGNFVIVLSLEQSNKCFCITQFPIWGFLLMGLPLTLFPLKQFPVIWLPLTQFLVT